MTDDRAFDEEYPPHAFGEDNDKELPDKAHPDPLNVKPWEEDPNEYEGVGADVRNQRYDRVD